MVNQDKIVLKLSYQWLLLLILALGEMVILICNGINDNNGFAVFRTDPGTFGMMIVVSLLSIYSLMPLVINLVDRYCHRYFRYAVLVFTFLILFAFFLHHLDHITRGERPDWYSNMLEGIHHIVALWTIYSTFKWTKLAK